MRALGAKRVHVVLVLDEMHTVYTLPAAEGAPWLTQLASIINSSSAAVSVVVSGSSVYMRDLCFGKHPPCDAEFPTYRYAGIRRNLNSDRTRVLHLGPITTAPMLKWYLASRVPAVMLSAGEMEALFQATGGTYRELDFCLAQDPSRWFDAASVSKLLRHVDNYRYAPLLQALA